MAKKNSVSIQPYPRIEEGKFSGYLDETKLKPHTNSIEIETLKKIIDRAIHEANLKSSRKILDLPDDISTEDADKIYVKEGVNLFNYFLKYCGDPAATAFECLGQHYTKIAKEQFHNKALQRQRMNSGWRYQFIVKDCAMLLERFKSVSDIGTSEADFNAIVEVNDGSGKQLNIYVSVKNRSNTMGGQDWPKAIYAIEGVANTDKNRVGAYICVFGIAMEKGLRNIKKQQGSNMSYSNNTEVWYSDFFWPFFSNYGYEEMMNVVLSVLLENKSSMPTEGNPEDLEVTVPELLVKTFGEKCKENGLLDENGRFNNAQLLLKFFCTKGVDTKISRKTKKVEKTGK